MQKTVPDFTLDCSGFTKPNRAGYALMLQLWDAPNCKTLFTHRPIVKAKGSSMKTTFFPGTPFDISFSP